MKYINLDYHGKISKEYGEKLDYTITTFACGEIEFKINEQVENEEITILQSFNVPEYNNQLIKLWIVCSVLKKNNVKNIQYIAPFLPYTRQDRSYDATTSLGSKLVARILEECDIKSMITFDIHAIQVESFFTCKVLNYSAIPLFIDDIKQNYKNEKFVLVFADIGSANRFKKFFKDDEFDIAIIRKIRTPNKEIKMFVLGDIKDKTAIILDDMIDSGGTIAEATNNLLALGAKNVDVYATHGIFSNNGIERLNNLNLRKIVISNTIQHDNLPTKFQVINIDNLIIN